MIPKCFLVGIALITSLYAADPRSVFHLPPGGVGFTERQTMTDIQKNAMRMAYSTQALRVASDATNYSYGECPVSLRMFSGPMGPDAEIECGYDITWWEFSGREDAPHRVARDAFLKWLKEMDKAEDYTLEITSSEEEFVALLIVVRTGSVIERLGVK